ncbi:uncharacterized protein UTRI_02054 [Ustilago trichophora]|uniref:Zn(2)-C6 fungal-type domain-containing protein n=1 Tax=Ustilago trichophora TaxID=86804 RepID=A0A5C3E1I3_9BASI|nr:uncharacterized protein UTRI_02054 [Ustilago trichophora]
MDRKQSNTAKKRVILQPNMENSENTENTENLIHSNMANRENSENPILGQENQEIQEIQENQEIQEIPATLVCFNCKAQPLRCKLEPGSNKCTYCRQQTVNCNVNDQIPAFKLEHTRTLYLQRRAASNPNRPVGTATTLIEPWVPAQTTFKGTGSKTSNPSKRKHASIDAPPPIEVNDRAKDNLEAIRARIKEFDQDIKAIEETRALWIKHFKGL